MWFDRHPPDTSWTVLWHDWIRCGCKTPLGYCSGIRKVEGLCAACGLPIPAQEPMVLPGGQIVHCNTYMGGERSHEDYIYLRLLEREWKRPPGAPDPYLSAMGGQPPSDKVSIVLLFWAYFETRIDRLWRTALRSLPEKILEDTLQQHRYLDNRLGDFYRTIFGNTYFDDLASMGFQRVVEVLRRSKSARDRFAHGHPTAIDDAVIRLVVENLEDEHNGWISVYNRRAALAQL